MGSRRYRVALLDATLPRGWCHYGSRDVRQATPGHAITRHDDLTARRDAVTAQICIYCMYRQCIPRAKRLGGIHRRNFLLLISCLSSEVRYLGILEEADSISRAATRKKNCVCPLLCRVSGRPSIADPFAWHVVSRRETRERFVLCT